MRETTSEPRLRIQPLPGIALPAAEVLEDVQAAGLRYVSDQAPGLRRRKSGKGFAYVSDKGAVCRDAAVLKRIRSLAIPPAWTDVWVCAQANGHIQATGDPFGESVKALEKAKAKRHRKKNGRAAPGSAPSPAA